MYPLIIGESGTGKTSLIKLALNKLEEPKGVIYVDIPYIFDTPIQIIGIMQKALGWTADPG